MGTDSRAAGALLARASTLHLQTGNLLNWGRLRKKCPSTHSEEVSTAGPSPGGCGSPSGEAAGERASGDKQDTPGLGPPGRLSPEVSG